MGITNGTGCEMVGERVASTGCTDSYLRPGGDKEWDRL